MTSAVALLAAGHSRRFGGDKLVAPLWGKMVGLHASDTLAQIPFDCRWVVVADLAHPCVAGWRAAGFEPVVNTCAVEGMGSSVALAGSLAATAGVERLIIALADMPLVPASHFAALLRHGQGPEALVASSDGQAPMPPALFGRRHFARLTQALGDSGARAMIADAQLVAVSADWLVDIDDPTTLAAVQARLGQGDDSGRSPAES